MSRVRGCPPWLWTPVVLAADFATKRLVLANSEALSGKMEVLGEFFRLAYVRNPGAAMGIFHGGRPFLVAISIVASIVLALLYRRTPADLRIRRAAVAAILGGALGNLVDRVFYGGLVVDFLDFGIGTHRFYTFNVADAAVTLGGAVLFFSLWIEGGADGRARTPAAGPAAATADDSPAAADEDV